MGLRTTESVVVPATPGRVFPHVAELDRYPSWLGLVHRAARDVDTDADSDVDAPAWLVEIRAQVGPLARSKQLRMVRTVHEPDRRVEFERDEVDGREHARWSLRVELTPEGSDATLVTMHLDYDGSLWTGGVLDRVLEREVAKGRGGLAAMVNAAPTP